MGPPQAAAPTHPWGPTPATRWDLHTGPDPGLAPAPGQNPVGRRRTEPSAARDVSERCRRPGPEPLGQLEVSARLHTNPTSGMSVPSLLHPSCLCPVGPNTTLRRGGCEGALPPRFASAGAGSKTGQGEHGAHVTEAKHSGPREPMLGGHRAPQNQRSLGTAIPSTGETLWLMGDKVGAPLGCFALKNIIQGEIRSRWEPEGADVPPALERSSAALPATPGSQPGANCPS